jgi:hypothetical protein
VAAALAVGAVVCVVVAVLGFLSLDDRVDGLPQVDAPGEAEVVLEAGEYTVYLRGVNDAVSFGSVRVLLEPAGGGEPVDITDTGLSTTYTLGSRHLQSVGEFTITEPGTYVLSASEPTVPGITGVAVGTGIGRWIVLPIALILAAIFVLTPATLLVWLVTFFRRRGFVTRQAAAMASTPGFPHYPAMAGPVPVAGWHPDPGRRHQLRYWDGTRWTDQVSDNGTQSTDPL